MIYAVDFDGTLCKSAWPDIGEANKPMIDFLKQEKREGATLILWTMREGEALEEAVKWCKARGLTFDAVNDNAAALKADFGDNPRKVYADIYIDDHNAPLYPFDNPANWYWYAMIAKMEEKAKLAGKESPVVLADEETGQRAAEVVGPYEREGVNA